MKKTLIATAISLAAFASASQAASESFNFNLAEQKTDINQTGSLNYFDSSLGTLTSVTLTIDGQAQTDITLTNNSQQTQNRVQGTSNIGLFYDSSISQLDSFLSANSPIVNINLATGYQSITAGNTYDSGTKASGDILQSYTEADGLVDSWFVGTGAFDISCDSSTSFTLAGGGGNISSTQATYAGCSGAITYNYTPTPPPPPSVPEPAMLSLLGLGFTAMAFRRRQAV